MDKHAFIAKYGPWAVVTGASSGIGLAIATELAEFGFSGCRIHPPIPARLV